MNNPPHKIRLTQKLVNQTKELIESFVDSGCSSGYCGGICRDCVLYQFYYYLRDGVGKIEVTE